MRKLFVLGAVIALLIAVAIPASALTAWYGGNPDLFSGEWSQQGGAWSGAMAYDDFQATGIGLASYTLTGNFLNDDNITQMYYEIRPASPTATAAHW